MAAPENAPTFNWTGPGAQEGAHIHYASFNFAGQHYALGECVYLLPEEEGAPPYIARLVRAYEDTTAKEVERLVIEVRVGTYSLAVAAAGARLALKSGLCVCCVCAVCSPAIGCVHCQTGCCCWWRFAPSHTHQPTAPTPTPNLHLLQVQWFERRGSLPASVGGSMHEAEVVESDLVDTNLVGCLDSKALILRANSYEEVCALGGLKGRVWLVWV
jgi:hypothetical protein